MVFNRKTKTCPEPFDSAQDKLSRRIQNLKWAGFFAIVVLLVGYVGTAEAQQQGRVYRIGYLQTSSREQQLHLISAFEQGMRDLGYVVGKNLVI